MGESKRATITTDIRDVIRERIGQVNDPEGYLPAEVTYKVEEGKFSLDLKLHVVVSKAKFHPTDDGESMEVYLRTFSNIFKIEYADALYIHKEVIEAFKGKERPVHTVYRLREGCVVIYRNTAVAVMISTIPFTL